MKKDEMKKGGLLYLAMLLISLGMAMITGPTTDQDTLYLGATLLIAGLLLTAYREKVKRLLMAIDEAVGHEVSDNIVETATEKLEQLEKSLEDRNDENKI